jgi:hypothetical protein
MLYVKLCSFGRMVICVLRMSVSRVRVVSRGFVIARLVVLRSVAMMFRCARVMLRCLMMVLGCLFRHLFLLFSVDRWCVSHASSLLLLPDDRDVNPSRICGKFRRVLA